jgi:hypothetical protein
MRADSPGRRAAVSLEYVLVLPIFVFFIQAMVVGGLGVFRANEVGWLAQESARWASVRGGQYSLDTGQPAATPNDVYQNVILPRSSLLDSTALNYSVTWDDSSKLPSYLDANNKVHTNRVTVTITYQWIPELFLGGLTITRTAQMEVCY